VRLKLKNAALADAGYVEIRTVGGQAVEIVSCNAAGAGVASVLLSADGTIRLQAQRIVVAGDLETQRIRYLSSDGVTVKDLA
jgi:hypothetical protein